MLLRSGGVVRQDGYDTNILEIELDISLHSILEPIREAKRPEEDAVEDASCGMGI